MVFVTSGAIGEAFFAVVVVAAADIAAAAVANVAIQITASLVVGAASV